MRKSAPKRRALNEHTVALGAVEANEALRMGRDYHGGLADGTSVGLQTLDASRTASLRFWIYVGSLRL